MSSCERVLSKMQSLVTDTRSASTRKDFNSLQARINYLTSYFTKRGYDQDFAHRHVIAMTLMALQFNLHVLNLKLPEFYDQLAALGIDPLRFSNQVGGSFFTGWTPDGNSLQFVVTLDPNSEVVSFEDAVFEEILHARFEKFEFTEYIVGPIRKLPYIFTDRMAGLKEMISELLTKETIQIHGKEMSRDRTETLAKIGGGYLDDHSDLVSFGQLAQTLIGCSRRSGTTWRDLSLYRYLRCILSINTESEFTKLVASAPTSDLTDVLKSIQKNL
jgi:hypothetical protein